MTVAKCSLRSPGSISVRSPARTRSGSPAVKSRRTKFAAAVRGRPGIDRQGVVPAQGVDRGPHPVPGRPRPRTGRFFRQAPTGRGDCLPDRARPVQGPGVGGRRRSLRTRRRLPRVPGGAGAAVRGGGAGQPDRAVASGPTPPGPPGRALRKGGRPDRGARRGPCGPLLPRLVPAHQPGPVGGGFLGGAGRRGRSGGRRRAIGGERGSDTGADGVTASREPL